VCLDFDVTTGGTKFGIDIDLIDEKEAIIEGTIQQLL